MTLVIEDGTEIASANSYVTDAEFVTYAADRGYTIPSSASDREVLLIKAVDYLEGLEQQYQGYRASSTQVLAFPRNDVMLHGYSLASDSIPTELKNAQMELAFQLSTEEILVNEVTNNLAGFSVEGVYSETYNGESTQQVITAKANAYLAALLFSTSELQRV